MENQEDLIKESASIIEEIEDQLDKILAKKREEIETELESKIKRDRKEAKEKMEKLEQELSGERESLKSYRSALSEFDIDKQEIKAKIKDHLSKAAEYQPQIEDLAAKTINELKMVIELNEKLEELNLTALSRIEEMKVELKDRIEKTPIPAPKTPVPSVESKEQNDIQSSLDSELDKLKKIKELLGKDSAVRKELTEIEANSLPEVVEIPKDETPQENMAEQEVEKEVEEEAEKEVIPPKEEEVIPSEEEEPKAEEKKSGSVGSVDIPDVDLERMLEKYRKSIDGEKGIKLTYFENNKKMLLDGQDILNAIDKNIQEAQKLYDKLAETKSPKEQFFTKQEIIWHQETLREFILTTIKVCEKENASLPQSTADVLNIDVLKEILDKVSRENWSNKDYYASFFQFAGELKTAYVDRTTPKSVHIRSLLEELEITQ